MCEAVSFYRLMLRTPQPKTIFTIQLKCVYCDLRIFNQSAILIHAEYIDLGNISSLISGNFVADHPPKR